MISNGLIIIECKSRDLNLRYQLFFDYFFHVSGGGTFTIDCMNIKIHFIMMNNFMIIIISPLFKSFVFSNIILYDYF